MLELGNTRTISESRKILEKAEYSRLSTIELLSSILGSVEISKEVVKKTNMESDNFTMEKLLEIKGIGEKSAAKIIAMNVFFKRVHIEDIIISSSDDVFKLCYDIVNEKQEVFVAITINGAGGLIKKRVVYKGTVNQSLVHPREIFVPALKEGACAMILAHNHPSGILRASKEDIEVTTQLVKAGSFLGIPVLDHIIVSKKGYFSFHSQGLL